MQNFDYSTPAAYFITFCTKDRAPILGAVVGASIARPQNLQLSACGKLVEIAIRNIPAHYPAVAVENHVVMPNHVHLLLQINTDSQGQNIPAPTIGTVVQQLKGWVTKQIGSPIWQKSFHDHVVRNEKDYLKIWEYIDTNPIKWQEDCFYVV